MNDRIKIRPVFNRKKTLNTEGKAIVSIEVYFCGSRIRRYIATKLYLSPKDWDTKTNWISLKHSTYNNFNQYLKNFIREVEEYQFSLLKDGKDLTPELIEQYREDKAPIDFIEFATMELEKDLKIEPKTVKELKYTLNTLKSFKSNLKFHEINNKLIDEFDYWMRAKANLHQNTIHKHHSNFKKYINIAVRKDLFEEKNNPYKNFISPRIKGDRTNLSHDEVKKIELLIDSDQVEINHVRDMFLFACYTGLRFQDVIDLTPDSIEQGKEGLFIKHKMEKVDRPVLLPISLLFKGKSVEILEKYKAMPRMQKQIFPTYSNQSVNRILKIICLSCGIRKNVSFHIARHTFGSLLAEITQNPYLIMDLMGHNDIKTSMIYIHNSQERLNKQLKGANWD